MQHELVEQKYVNLQIAAASHKSIEANSTKTGLRYFQTFFICYNPYRVFIICNLFLSFLYNLGQFHVNGIGGFFIRQKI